ncbi:MAG: RDD family protein [Deltaproteobacteria bacterium]|jgi:uncharacterized RDD family membrane protein YckC|nr:RDD family protein [Deltaproteobacteria bacterium]
MPLEPREDLQVYAPPRTEPKPEGDADEFPDPDAPGLIGAEFWPRAAARVIDWVYITIVSSVAGFSGGILLAVLEAVGTVAPGWAERVGQGGIGSMVVGTIATIGYQTLSEGLHGASFGKLCMKLRVVNTAGGRAGLWSGLVRNVAFLVDSLFFGMIGASAMGQSPTNQRYGDRWARTLVVRVERLQPSQRPSTAQFLAALAVASAVAGAINTGYLIFNGLG